ncbi:MAG TPA: PspA/IM30 family protein, partial [Thermodesulfobacteriota bacterium]|nr:PspA/IM30 family protein [Thermodesulfobacteriota bacterium]
KSQLNDWVSRAEDPEKMLNQAVEEMEEGLERARAKIGALRFRINEQEKLSHRIGEQVKYWRERAEDYLKRDMEENAVEAVRKKRMLEEKAGKLSLAQAGDRAKLNDFEARYAELEERVRTAKTKRALLLKEIAITKGAPASKEDITGCAASGTDEPFDTFRRAEERVTEDTEAYAQDRERESEEREREARLVREEVENLKKSLSKGGSRK